MKLYIDKIDDKNIHIKRIGTNNNVIDDFSTFATFKANIGIGKTITINDLTNNGMNFSSNLSELYINGTLAPQNMDDAIKALVFIGSFKNGGGASGQTPGDGLSSVATDNTLIGNGTSALPLGVNHKMFVENKLQDNSAVPADFATVVMNGKLQDPSNISLPYLEKFDFMPQLIGGYTPDFTITNEGWSGSFIYPTNLSGELRNKIFGTNINIVIDGVSHVFIPDDSLNNPGSPYDYYYRLNTNSHIILFIQDQTGSGDSIYLTISSDIFEPDPETGVMVIPPEFIGSTINEMYSMIDSGKVDDSQSFVQKKDLYNAVESEGYLFGIDSNGSYIKKDSTQLGGSSSAPVRYVGVLDGTYTGLHYISVASIKKGDVILDAKINDNGDGTYGFYIECRNESYSIKGWWFSGFKIGYDLDNDTSTSIINFVVDYDNFMLGYSNNMDNYFFYTSGYIGYGSLDISLINNWHKVTVNYYGRTLWLEIE